MLKTYDLITASEKSYWDFFISQDGEIIGFVIDNQDETYIEINGVRNYGDTIAEALNAFPFIKEIIKNN